MGFIHQSPKLRQVVSFEGLLPFEHPIIFGNHVTTTSIHDLGHAVLVRFEFGFSNVAQRVNPGQGANQMADSSLALRSPTVVLAGSQFMFDHRIANHQPHLVRQGQKIMGKRTTIEQQRFSALTEARNKLIHYSATHADKLVFCALAKPCQLGPLNRNTRIPQQGQTGCHLDRRG